MKIYLILENWKNLNFVFSIIHVKFCPQVYQNLKCYDGENVFIQISGYLPKLEIIESAINNIFADDCFSKLF